jgi:proline iminopeptidase
MRELYPNIEPHDRGMLEVGDGNRIYWEVSGNPQGKPAIVFHGGPGAGSTPVARRFFDPGIWRIIQFDQRGCGKSTPHASLPGTALRANTTQHLLGDIESLRGHLAVGRWLVFGSSWGATLALAYAQTYPKCVSQMVLSSITTSRSCEIHWLYHEAGRLFPQAWARFRAGARASNPDANLVEAYYRLLDSTDIAVREEAARNWCDWEAAVVSVDPNHRPHPRYGDADFRMAFARIVKHYFHHKAWLEDGILLRNACLLAGIPGALIHGRLDIGSPLDTAWELSQAWPGSELIVVQHAGHEVRTPAMRENILDALARFAERWRPRKYF